MCSPCESGLSEQATLYICPPRGSRTTGPQLGSIPYGSRFAPARLGCEGGLALERFFLIYAGCGSSFGRSRFFVVRGDGPWLMI